MVLHGASASHRPSGAVRGGETRIRVIDARRRAPLIGGVLWALLGVVCLATALLLGGGAALLGLYVRAAATLPDVPPFEELRARPGSVLTASDGHVIGEFFDEEQRLELDFDQIPVGLIFAVQAAEDERFFEHSGLDFRGILRAAWVNFRKGAFVEGASTITQQLAKSVLGRPGSFGDDAGLSLHQKLREAIYARRLEDVYSKEQILLLYLNRIFFGHHSYGVRAAARNYFRKNLNELTLTEMALLAGLPQAPSALNPLRPRGRERARKRLVHVLGQMERNGFITASQRAAAAEASLTVYPLADPFGEGVPYFVRAVTGELRRRFGTADAPGAWRRLGLRVETTADLAWHRTAEVHLAEGLRRLDKKQGYRGPLLHLESADHATFFDRVARELRGRAPEDGTIWPALVEAVDAGGVDVRLTAAADGAWVGRIALGDMRWAGRYEEGAKVSFGRELQDPRKVFRAGDVVLVRVGVLSESGLRLSLEQEPQVEGAIVAVDPHTGYTRVLHGGYDFDRSEVNRAHAVRQTGSAVKPAIYSLAYDLDLAPSTLLSGAPYREGDYAPTSARGKGDLIVWDALTTSENNVSLRVMNFVQQRGGTNRLRSWVRALGLDQPMNGYTAEVLGVDQTPWGMTRMMATFARGGLASDPVLIRRIIDADGRVLQRPPAFSDPANGPVDTLDALHRLLERPPERAIPETTAFLTAANLREVFRRGTARREGRSLSVPACGKTGTLAYDVWFTGFTSEVAATVWVGADRRERILGAGRTKSRVYGANTALPIWRDFLNEALAGRSGTDPVPEPPEDVVVVPIDPETGWLAAGKGRAVPHRKGTEPVSVAPPAIEGSDAEVLQSDF